MESLIETLHSFGFSKNEARVYVSLIKESSATGYQISKTTGISRAEVYRVLNNLAEKGAVMWQQTDPVMYMPVPPETYLSRLERQFSDNIRKARDELQEIGKQYRTDAIVYLKGYDHVIHKTTELIRFTKHELYIRCGAVLAERMKAELKSLTDSGVRVRILVYGEFELEGATVVAHPVRDDEAHRHRGSQLLLISDIRKMLVSQLEPSEGEQVSGTYSESWEVIRIVREMFRSSFHMTIIATESDLVPKLMAESVSFTDIFKDGFITKYD